MAEIDKWLRLMPEVDASDLHLASNSAPMMRIHGDVGPIEGEPVLTGERLTGIMKEVCPPNRWERYQKTGDMDFAYSLEGVARFRVNFLMQIRGPGCVLRLIPAKIKSLEELGAPEGLKSFAKYRNGLILVTGPTGSGKSTTLAAMIHDINQNYYRHIITIEDPIEFVHQNANSIVTQREVGEDTTEFARALKDALREDPDVILVGEMRDLETTQLAITVAETGVLVFGTLHTNSASKTVDRLIDIFPAKQQPQVRTMLSESLKGVIAQQLLRRGDGTGRIAAHEILVGTPALGNIIREGAIEKIPSVIQSGREMGMIAMDTTLRHYMNELQITGNEAYMKALDKNNFKEYWEPEEEALTLDVPELIERVKAPAAEKGKARLKPEEERRIAKARARALLALAEHGAKANGALPVLRELLGEGQDENGEVKAAAHLALAKITNSPDEHIQPLVDLLRDPDPHVRFETIGCLCLLGARAAPATPALNALLKDEKAGIRSHAAKALKGM